MYFSYLESPCGLIKIIATDTKLEEIRFLNHIEQDFTNENEITKKFSKELSEYFFQRRKTFSMDLILKGTEFQKEVWNALMEIPYGEVITYKDLAEKIDNPKAYRAVGNANNKNKIPIIIPCHRVIGSKGNLVGYAGGIDLKYFLIEHEKANRYLPEDIRWVTKIKL